jgi:DNA-binding response OmpR family regulator
MRKIILIVEDNPVFRRGLERLLTAEGYEAHAFASAEAAAEAAKSGDYDVALLDVRLPGMTGEELGVMLKKRYAKKPIAFVTSEFAHNSQLKRRIPGCEILPKPVHIENLLGMLRIMTLN